MKRTGGAAREEKKMKGIYNTRGLMLLMLICVLLSSCAADRSVQATTPEAHTKSFLQNLFENPVK